LFISSGDLIGASPLVSALFKHEPTIEAFNRAALDVGVVGNHEFDAGIEELIRLRDGGCTAARDGDPVRSCGLQPHKGARFPFLGANVQRGATSSGTAASPLPPSRVFQVGPHKVGVIGAVTRVTPQLVVPSGVAGLEFTDEAEAINAEAARLKAQGVRTLIVSLHEGAEIGHAGRPADWNDTTCPGLRGEAVEIARRITPDVDLILTAHTHQGYNCRLAGRPMMQAVSYGRGLSVADLHLDPRTGDVMPEKTIARNLPVVNAQTAAEQREALAQAEPPAFGTALRQSQPRSDITALVRTAAQAAAPQANRVVGQVAAAFDRRGRGDSSLGRLIADAQWEATRAPEAGGSDFALMNPGGIRTDLACRGTPPCPVTYGDLFSMQPFGNSLVVMTLTGAQVQALLEQQDRFGRDGPLMSPSAGLSYRWAGDAPKGQRAVDIHIKGKPLDPDARYRVTVNSFMAEGGDGLNILKQGQQRLGGGQDIDVLMSYLRKGVAQPTGARIR
jgi:5'-nucleotidase